MGKVGKLVVVKGAGRGLSCQLREGEEVSVGRNPNCSIPVPDIRMSKIHCVVRNIGGVFEVLDNNSSNGTYMNGQKVELCSKILPGDIIEIGDTEIEFTSEEEKDEDEE